MRSPTRSRAINLETVGIILMLAGAAGLLLTFVWQMMSRRRGDVVYERERPVERRVDPPPR